MDDRIRKQTESADLTLDTTISGWSSNIIVALAFSGVILLAAGLLLVGGGGLGGFSGENEDGNGTIVTNESKTEADEPVREPKTKNTNETESNESSETPGINETEILNETNESTEEIKDEIEAQEAEESEMDETEKAEDTNEVNEIKGSTDVTITDLHLVEPEPELNEYRLTVEVVDAETGAPIEGARITGNKSQNSGEGDGLISLRTDRNGRASMTTQAGNYGISIEAEGYEPATATLKLKGEMAVQFSLARERSTASSGIDNNPGSTIGVPVTRP